MLTGIEKSGSKYDIAKGSFPGKAEGLRWLELCLEEGGDERVSI